MAEYDTFNIDGFLIHVMTNEFIPIDSKDINLENMELHRDIFPTASFGGELNASNKECLYYFTFVKYEEKQLDLEKLIFSQDIETLELVCDNLYNTYVLNRFTKLKKIVINGKECTYDTDTFLPN